MASIQYTVFTHICFIRLFISHIFINYYWYWGVLNTILTHYLYFCFISIYLTYHFRTTLPSLISSLIIGKWYYIILPRNHIIVLVYHHFSYLFRTALHNYWLVALSSQTDSMSFVHIQFFTLVSFSFFFLHTQSVINITDLTLHICFIIFFPPDYVNSFTWFCTTLILGLSFFPLLT